MLPVIAIRYQRILATDVLENLMKTRIFCLLLLLLALAACATRPQPPVSAASLILVGATLVTNSQPMVIRDGGVIIGVDGRIRFIGSSEEARAQAPAGSKILDLHGATVLPGLTDAHAHIEGLGVALDNVDLVDTSSYDEVVSRVAERAATLPAGEWVQGRGWDQNDWRVREFPTAAALDAAVPDHPVALSRVDGHAILANSAAMRAAGVTASTPDPEGGRILRDAQGNPTGVFVDNAEALITRAIPPASRETRKRRILHAAQVIAQNGLTEVHDAGVDGVGIALFRELIDEGVLPIRVYAMLADNPALLDTWFAGTPLINYSDQLTVRTVKLYADGALGSRGAAMLEPYTDDPGNRGLLVSSEEHLQSVAQAATAAGFQVATHAIGDRGVRNVIDAYEAAGARAQDRPRIEHLQVMSLDDLPRIQRLGIIASMQPTHATSDMPWAEDRLGPDRIHGAYAWRTMENAGVPLAFGSDFPVERVNPFLGIYSAVTRQDRDGNPAGGWYPEESLSPAEALRAFTLGAAYAAFEEESRGTLEVGKLGDLTVVDANPLEIDPSKLDDIQVRYTILGGKIVYQNPAE